MMPKILPEGPLVVVEDALWHESEPDYYCCLRKPQIEHVEALRSKRPHLWVDPRHVDRYQALGFEELTAWHWRKPRIKWLPRLMERPLFAALYGAMMHGAQGILIHWGEEPSPRKAMCLSKVILAAQAHGIDIQSANRL